MVWCVVVVVVLCFVAFDIVHVYIEAVMCHCAFCCLLLCWMKKKGRGGVSFLKSSREKMLKDHSISQKKKNLRYFLFFLFSNTTTNNKTFKTKNNTHTHRNSTHTTAIHCPEMQTIFMFFLFSFVTNTSTRRYTIPRVLWWLLKN